MGTPTTQRGWPWASRLELATVPVTHVDQAKASTVEQACSNAGHDQTGRERPRPEQLTPGSASSIATGMGFTSTTPDTIDCRLIEAGDIEHAPRALTARGCQPHVVNLATGPSVAFRDPDGAGRAVRELPPRARVSVPRSWERGVVRPSIVRQSHNSP